MSNYLLTLKVNEIDSQLQTLSLYTHDATFIAGLPNPLNNNMLCTDNGGTSYDIVGAKNITSSTLTASNGIIAHGTSQFDSLTIQHLLSVVNLLVNGTITTNAINANTIEGVSGSIVLSSPFNLNNQQLSNVYISDSNLTIEEGQIVCVDVSATTNMRAPTFFTDSIQANLSEKVTIGSPTTISGTLTVGGVSTFNFDIFCYNIKPVNPITGINITGPVAVTSGLRTNTLVVSGQSTFQGGVNFSGQALSGVIITGPLFNLNSSTGDITCHSITNQAGITSNSLSTTTLSCNSLDPAIQILSPTTFAGSATFNNALFLSQIIAKETSAGIGITGPVIITGGLTSDSILSTGPATFNTTVDCKGVLTAESGIITTGIRPVNPVAGVAITGPVTVSNGLATDTLTASGNVTVSGSLTLHGELILDPGDTVAIPNLETNIITATGSIISINNSLQLVNNSSSDITLNGTLKTDNITSTRRITQTDPINILNNIKMGVDGSVATNSISELQQITLRPGSSTSSSSNIIVQAKTAPAVGSGVLTVQNPALSSLVGTVYDSVFFPPPSVGTINLEQVLLAGNTGPNGVGMNVAGITGTQPTGPGHTNVWLNVGSDTDHNNHNILNVNRLIGDSGYFTDISLTGEMFSHTINSETTIYAQTDITAHNSVITPLLSSTQVNSTHINNSSDITTATLNATTGTITNLNNVRTVNTGGFTTIAEYRVTGGTTDIILNSAGLTTNIARYYIDPLNEVRLQGNNLTGDLTVIKARPGLPATRPTGTLFDSYYNPVLKSGFGTNYLQPSARSLVPVFQYLTTPYVSSFGTDGPISYNSIMTLFEYDLPSDFNYNNQFGLSLTYLNFDYYSQFNGDALIVVMGSLDPTNLIPLSALKFNWDSGGKNRLEYNNSYFESLYSTPLFSQKLYVNILTSGLLENTTPISMYNTEMFGCSFNCSNYSYQGAITTIGPQLGPA